MGMRRLRAWPLRSSRILRKKLVNSDWVRIPLLSKLQVHAREWGNNRVGTIHTVQGREADTVILVLGAPKASQSGARSWAAGTPNIFNVAVSRAKQDLYVIGSHGAWSGVGHARELGASTQRIRV